MEKQRVDFTLIVPLDTLTGVDMLSLANRSKWNIQLLGVKGGWNANIDTAKLYSVPKDALDQLESEKKHGHGDYRVINNAAIEESTVLAPTVLMGNVKGRVLPHIWENCGKKLIRLEKAQTQTAIQALSEWLSEPLLELELAHATFERDYIPGLAKEGIALSSIAEGKEPAKISLTDILTRSWEIESPLCSSLNDIDFNCDYKVIDLNDVVLYLVDEAKLENSAQYECLKKTFFDRLHLFDAKGGGNGTTYNEMPYTKKAIAHKPYTLKTALVLFCKGETTKSSNMEAHVEQLSRVELIEFVTSQNEKTELESLAGSEPLEGLAEAITISGQYSHYFMAIIRQRSLNDTRGIIDYIVDNLFGISLKGGRPLRHYGCTFFLPFRLKNKKEALQLEVNKKWSYEKTVLANKLVSESHREIGAKNETDGIELNERERFNTVANERDAYLYFQPVVRKRLFDFSKSSGQTPSLDEWRLDISSPDSKVYRDTGYEWGLQDKFMGEVLARIDNMYMYGFYNKVYIFAVQVHERFFEGKSSFCREENNWWHDFYSDDQSIRDQVKKSTLAIWLNYTDKMRQLSPSFEPRCRDVPTKFALIRSGDKNKFSERENEYEKLKDRTYELPKDIKDLMLLLCAGDIPEFEPFIDNRMFVNVSYGLAGNPKINESSSKIYDMLFTLAAYVDPEFKGFSRLDGYAYDRQFIKEKLQKEQYGRWSELGSRFAFTDYSNVYMGYGNEYNHNIGPCHVFYNYQYMLLLGLFYRETLHDFSQKVSDVSERIDHVQTSNYQELKKDFVKFTNISWFQEVSSQIQGKEIFKKITEGLEISIDYGFIKNEIEAADQYFQNKFLIKMSISAGILALAPLFLVVIEVLFGGERVGVESVAMVLVSLIFICGLLYLFRDVICILVEYLYKNIFSLIKTFSFRCRKLMNKINWTKRKADTELHLMPAEVESNTIINRKIKCDTKAAMSPERIDG